MVSSCHRALRDRRVSSTLPTRYPYGLMIMQTVTERVLEQFAVDLGVTVQ